MLVSAALIVISLPGDEGGDPEAGEAVDSNDGDDVDVDLEPEEEDPSEGTWVETAEALNTSSEVFSPERESSPLWVSGNAETTGDELSGLAGGVDDVLFDLLLLLPELKRGCHDLRRVPQRCSDQSLLPPLATKSTSTSSSPSRFSAKVRPVDAEDWQVVRS
jgi:hypothetical protein